VSRTWLAGRALAPGWLGNRHGRVSVFSRGAAMMTSFPLGKVTVHSEAAFALE
jgi:hypothetical protein